MPKNEITETSQPWGQCFGLILLEAEPLSQYFEASQHFCKQKLNGPYVVKGISGYKISTMKALIIVTLIWIYAILSACPPFLFNWGGYNLEGLLYTCTYDYLTEDWNHQSYILFTFFNHWFLPMVFIFYFYSSIIKAVIAHEAALKSQARKMGLQTIRCEVGI